MISGYYNNFNPKKNYEQLLFRSTKGLQTRELNELQAQQIRHVRGVGDAIFSDGDVIRGGEVTIDQESNKVTVESSLVYVRGHVRELDSVALTISLVGKVSIGVWLSENVVTELEDADLVNPAKETRGFQEPGAARLQVVASWGTDIDGDGDFYPVHEIIDGVLRQNTPPPQLDAVTSALARYDRESNGSYIVNGLQVSYLHTKDHIQSYSLSEGKAHVEGFEVSLPHAIRLNYPEGAELHTVESEPHRFEPDDNGDMRINLDYAPLAAIMGIDITVERTVTLSHGSYSGAKDPLPDSAVLEIAGITQGETEYLIGSDVKLTGGTVDWSLPGNEPAPGSSYDITYQYRTKVEGVDFDTKGFTVSGAVVGSLVLVDYQWALPRIDLITLDQNGNVRQVKGMSHPWTPPMPSVPTGQLLIARVYQNWLTAPDVHNDGVRVVAMSGLEQMQTEISKLYDLVAIERLKTDAIISEPAAKKGVFVDPFIDDDMRDQGLDQDAAIIDGELMLPIDVELIDATITEPVMLDCTPVVALEQLDRTGNMKINPYQAFDPLPATIKLKPSVDNWSHILTRWTSEATRRIARGSGNRSRTTTSFRNEIAERQTTQDSTLRIRNVGFSVDGFGEGETLDTILFDGVEVQVL